MSTLWHQIVHLAIITIFDIMQLKNTLFLITLVTLSGVLYSSCQTGTSAKVVSINDSASLNTLKKSADPAFDTALFSKKMLALGNGDTTGLWPVKAPYPLPGAIFPFSRIVAFYGNLYSTKMGILGELPKDQMLKKLMQEVNKWHAADTSVPVLPGLHYIAVTAQGSPGKDGKYRLRMPFHQIDTIISWAKEINAQVFLDVQVGGSTVKDEISKLETYMKMPGVHLGIDPEFSMKSGERPGTKIGTFNAEDINTAVDFLAGVVKKNNLSPKILIIHRFTQGMITDYSRIKKVPEVQIVIDMDGWGDKILKTSSYMRYVYKEPVQFTGFKLFYKNDIKRGKQGLFQPGELLKFTPQPIYIQYQ